MGNWFGKKKSRVTEQDKAILQLKQQRDVMRQYQKRITNQLEADRILAKQLLIEKRKERAKLLLRKKKFQESLLDKTEGQLNNIEQMVHNLEFAQIEVKVVQGLKDGNEALKKINQLLNIADIEKLLDETQEAVEFQKEIDALLAGGLTQEDEEDVLSELDDLLKESATPAAKAVGENIRLPDVPTDKITEPMEDVREKPRNREKEKSKKAMVAAS